MKPWATNKIKASGELINVLARHRYAKLDPCTGQVILYLTALQKKETIQSVAAWFKDKTIADLLLGELREQLEINGLPPLRDYSDSEEDVKRAFGFKQFGRRIGE